MHPISSLLAVGTLAASPLLAQHVGHGAPAAATTDATAAPATGQPPHLAQGWAPPVEDRMKFHTVLIDRLEFSSGDASDALTLDAQGWYGGDRNKFWWKAEGSEALTGANAGEGEVQALYSRLIAPFWDFQAGVRHDGTWGDAPDRDRSFLVLGFEGLAPYWFELGSAVFVSEDGDLSARLSATYDALLTQRWVLQPRLDLDAALQNAPEFGVGSGLGEVEFGVRLRYEFRRELAPYAGVSWGRRLGKTADLARSAGTEVDDFRFVVGLRLGW